MRIFILFLLVISLVCSFPLRPRITKFSLTRSYNVPRNTVLDPIPDIALCDFRVGKILSVRPINTFSDFFYLAKIDIGNEEPFEIHSSLIPDLESLTNQLVIVLCNILSVYKAQTSTGLIMCCVNSMSTEVAVLVPPDNAKIGEGIKVEGIVPQPTADLRAGTEAYSHTMPDLSANGEGIVCYQKKPIHVTSGGPVEVKIIRPLNEEEQKWVDRKDHIEELLPHRNYVWEDQGYEKRRKVRSQMNQMGLPSF